MMKTRGNMRKMPPLKFCAKILKSCYWQIFISNLFRDKGIYLKAIFFLYSPKNIKLNRWWQGFVFSVPSVKKGERWLRKNLDKLVVYTIIVVRLECKVGMVRTVVV